MAGTTRRKAFEALLGGSPPRLEPKKPPVDGVPKWLPKRKTPPPESATGFLLLDSKMNPFFSNAEAIQILSYPDKFAGDDDPALSVSEKIHARLMNRQPGAGTPFVTEFLSGRRHYFCRVFLVNSETTGPSRPGIAVLLERGPSALTSVSRVSQQFNLTQREQEALEYLLQGLSSKEIASRMSISPNTVKAFLRLIMTKMGVPSRAAVVAKILMK